MFVHVDRISVGFGDLPPCAVSAQDFDVSAWAWVQAKVNRPALFCRVSGRSSRKERKRLWAWLTRCVYFPLAGLVDMSDECKNRFYLHKIISVCYFGTGSVCGRG